MRSAFYEVDITPPLGCSIPGYFSARLGSDVKERIYAKAAVIDNGEKTIAILAIDSCGNTVETCDAITKRIEKYTGIRPENVMISATHTHTGGPNFLRDDDFFDGQGDKELDFLYLNMMQNLSADAVILAYKRLQKASLKHGVGHVDSISFIRNYVMKDGTIRTNPGRLNPDIVKPYGEIDPELTVVYFENEEKKPMGAIINFACHQDCVDGTEYSGDYSGIAALELKKQYGEDFITLYLPGTCGNINHFDVSRAEDPPDHYAKMGMIVAQEAKKTIAAAKEVQGTVVDVLREDFKLKKRKPTEEELAEAKDAVENIKLQEGVKLAADSSPDQFKLVMAKKLFAYIENFEEEYPICVQVLRVGDCLFYAFPCEVFVHFGMEVKKNSPSRKNVVASLCNGHRGYIPTRELFLPTVYEGKIGPSSLEVDAGYILADKLLEAAKKIW